MLQKKKSPMYKIMQSLPAFFLYGTLCFSQYNYYLCIWTGHCILMNIQCHGNKLEIAEKNRIQLDANSIHSSNIKENNQGYHIRMQSLFMILLCQKLLFFSPFLANETSHNKLIIMIIITIIANFSHVELFKTG